MSDMPPTAALRAAIDEMQAGHGAQGEGIVLEAVREAEARHGTDGFEHAAALFDLGRFYISMHDFRRAADAIRRAADLKLPGERGVKDRLTYLLNLGEMLKFTCDLDSAERVLRESLDRRREVYGGDHSGYAFGLEPLAEVVWLRGDPKEALALVRQAVNILWRDGNPQVISALGLRAFIHHAAEAENGAFADLPRLADEDIEAIIQDVLFRAEHLTEKQHGIPVLVDLCHWINAMRGEQHASLIPIAAMIAECERQIGDSTGRMQTLGLLAETCRVNNDMNQAIKVMQALAVAQDEAGLTDEAEGSYREALGAAREYGDHERLSSVLRNFGLYLKEQGRRAEAEALLREAVDEAKAAFSPESHGRGLVALGILIQHDGRLGEARPMLAEAIALLPQAHPDQFYARSHLNAIDRGGSCGCGDMGSAVSETLRALVLPSLPPDLIDDLRVEPGGGIHVNLSREPSPEEQELLQRVFEHATRELRRGVDRSGFA